MRTIEVDEDVYASLQRQAEAFVDTPNDVLRRVLLGRPLDARRSRTTGSQVHQGTGGRENDEEEQTSRQFRHMRGPDQPASRACDRASCHSQRPHCSP